MFENQKSGIFAVSVIIPASLHVGESVADSPHAFAESCVAFGFIGRSVSADSGVEGGCNGHESLACGFRVKNELAVKF